MKKISMIVIIFLSLIFLVACSKKVTVEFISDDKVVYSVDTMSRSNLDDPDIIPEKPGYTFNFWVYDGKKIEFPFSVPDDGAKIYARFSEDEYTVTFDSDGGSLLPSVSAKYGDVIYKPLDPEKDELFFIKWQADGKDVTWPLSIKDNLVLKAVWSTGYPADIVLSISQEGPYLVGESVVVSAVVYPLILDLQSVNFKSSDEFIASISETGVIMFLAKGSVTITLTSTIDPGVSVSKLLIVTDTPVIHNEYAKIYFDGKQVSTFENYVFDLSVDLYNNGNPISTTIIEGGEILAEIYSRSVRISGITHFVVRFTESLGYENDVVKYSKMISITGNNIKSGDNILVGIGTPWNNDEWTATVQVITASEDLTGIEIQGYPTKLEYRQGEKIVLNGIKVIAHYSNSASLDISHLVSIIDGNTNTVGNNITITIAYSGKTTIFKINVIAKAEITVYFDAAEFFSTWEDAYVFDLHIDLYNSHQTPEYVSSITLHSGKIGMSIYHAKIELEGVTHFHIRFMQGVSYENDVAKYSAAVNIASEGLASGDAIWVKFDNSKSWNGNEWPYIVEKKEG